MPSTALKWASEVELQALIDLTIQQANNTAILLVADDMNAAERLTSLKSVRFQERLISDTELNFLSGTFQSYGIPCQTVFGFEHFMELALAGKAFPAGVRSKIVIDKTEGGGHHDGFGPARRSMGALLAKHFGFQYGHANAYSAAITRHKHHQAMLMRQAGIGVPGTWSYDNKSGWTAGKPELGQKIICKSTYEAWSIGVSESTVGPFDDVMEGRAADLASEIGQPVCVQEFIEGREICALVVDNGQPMMVGLAEASSSTGAKSNGSYLIFDDHYRLGGIVYTDCDELGNQTRTAIAEDALRTFALLAMSNVGRIDFRVTSAGKTYVIDIADNPGTSEASSLAYILEKRGIAFEQTPLLLLGASLSQGPKA
jgi:D-alanine-D-alanine ligase